MNSYDNALIAIRSYSEQRQAELDKMALEARVETIKAYRKAAIEGICPNSPAFAVCLLLSQTIKIGREDGYPEVSYPENTKNILKAAIAAKIFPWNGRSWLVGKLSIHYDGSGFLNLLPEQKTDYEAWRDATEYKRNQSWKNL